jgi:hypothetical protein
MRGRVALALALLVTASSATGIAACGAPPDLRAKGDPLPEPSIHSPLPTIGVPPGFTPRPVNSPTAGAPLPWPEYTAFDCGGRPSKAQVSAVVRQEADIPIGEVIIGPLCSGTWQFTLFAVPGREPVKVLTRTTPNGPALVAAGTDVCSLDIQHQAPSGIYTVANC